MSTGVKFASDVEDACCAGRLSSTSFSPGFVSDVEDGCSSGTISSTEVSVSDVLFALSFVSVGSSIKPLFFIDLGTKYCCAMATFSGKSYPDNRITSIRSNSGPGMFSNWLAVQMNKTLLISTGTSKK